MKAHVRENALLRSTSGWVEQMPLMHRAALSPIPNHRISNPGH